MSRLDSAQLRARYERFEAVHGPLSDAIDAAIGRSPVSAAPYLEHPFDPEHQLLRARLIVDELQVMAAGARLALGHIDGAYAGHQWDQLHLRAATAYGIGGAARALREIRVAPLDITFGIEL